MLTKGFSLKAAGCCFRSCHRSINEFQAAMLFHAFTRRRDRQGFGNRTGCSEDAREIEGPGQEQASGESDNRAKKTGGKKKDVAKKGHEKERQ